MKELIGFLCMLFAFLILAASGFFNDMFKNDKPDKEDKDF
jgi:hypothetical protein